MWIRLVLDVSELTVPLEDFQDDLVKNGFVIRQYIEEKQELIVLKHISRMDYFKMNLNMVKGYIKGKGIVLKEKLEIIWITPISLSQIYNRTKRKITHTFKQIKRKLHVCKGKIERGFNKLRGKVSKLFKRGEPKDVVS